MLPLIPPTTLHDIAREFAGVSHNESGRVTSTAGGVHPATEAAHPASRHPRGQARFRLWSVDTLALRIRAWHHARNERRYGTRVVSRTLDRRPARTPVAFSRRVPGDRGDQDLAA